jgi:hypothetical protein
MITKSQFLSIISSDIAYEQNMVYAIDENGREHLMKNFADTLANKDTNSMKEWKHTTRKFFLIV